ncbi:MAG: LptF/LptG family permease [Crocinitomicaceae bacterium]|nr:LptF/LptG family permease [Crocinitomicaceae bacterium]
MIKKIDWYIIRKFLGTFIFITLIIMCLSVIFDISEKIDDFISKGAPINDLIFKYYLNFIIYYSNRFSPLIIFISVIFFTSKMAQNTEIIPILNSGRNFYRFLRPYAIAATILTIFSLFQNHYFVPKATKERLAFEEVYYMVSFSTSNKYYSISEDEVVYFNWHESAYANLREFRSEKWNGLELSSILYSPRADFDTINKDWHLIMAEGRYIGDTNDRVFQGKNIDTTFSYVIDDFAYRSEIYETMTYPELKDFMVEEAKMGNPTTFAELEMNQRTAFPFATYILTLIGVAVSSKKTRGGTGVHIAIGLFFALMYIFSMKISTVSATNAGLNPLIATWIPNFIFLIIGIILFRRTQT